MRSVSFLAMAALLSLGNVSQAADQRQCTLGGDKGKKATVEYYDPRIKQVADTIADIKKAGGDPNNVAIKVGEKFYTLPEIEAKLAKDKNLAIELVSSEVEKCNQDLKPLQDFVDGWVALQTGGLSKILPGKMAFVDVSDILAGYPLGGPDALIPKAREDLFKALGIGGTAAEVIRDPIKKGIVRPIVCIFGCKD